MVIDMLICLCIFRFIHVHIPIHLMITLIYDKQDGRTSLFKGLGVLFSEVHELLSSNRRIFIDDCGSTS